VTYQHETLDRNRQSWDAISANYQAHTRISTDDVHYGFLAPGERELGLLGEVAGKRTLEVGCGGGQNSIALAKQGATCIGIDPSSAQLAHAQRLAQEHGVGVQFVDGVAEDLSAFPDGSFDLVLSSYAFGYVTDLPRAYREAWRVLKPGGLFVFCLSHPWFQAVGWYLAGEPDAPEIKDYAAWPDLEEWDWGYKDGTSVRMRGYLWTLQQVVNELLEAGFVLERLVEQHSDPVGRAEDAARAAPEGLARFPYIHEFDPGSKLYEIECKLPHTLILRARKPGTGDG
jgi:ubiquinone/menaquinone biosynthesis C-methylase UbiE